MSFLSARVGGGSPAAIAGGSVEEFVLNDTEIEVLKVKGLTLQSVSSTPTVQNRKPLPLRVRDRTEEGCKAVLIPNAPEPFELDNGMVTGKAILKVRTNDPLDLYAPYFAGRQRMFEIQIQGKLKDIGPNDRVYMGIETAGPIKLSGFITKAAAKIVLSLISSTVQHAHCTLGNEREVGQLTFPMDVCVDRLAVTKPGDLAPTLGVQMLPEQYSRESRPTLQCYNTDDTYSFSLHSMYVDLVKFNLVNLPGLGTLSIDTFIKGQPLYFCAYILPKNHRGPHMAKDKRYLFRFELQNSLRKPHH